MPTLFSLTSVLVNVLIGLGINTILNSLWKDSSWTGLVVYLIIVLHSKYLLLEKVFKTVMMFDDTKTNHSKTNNEEK